LVTPCIWLGTTHPCNPPNYGLWVNLLFFMMWIYKHCCPPMLLVLAMKCCTKMSYPLPHSQCCCLLSSPISCLPRLLICTSTCLISSPIACPPSSVLCWCLLRSFHVCFFVFTSWSSLLYNNYVIQLVELVVRQCFLLFFMFYKYIHLA